MGRQMSKMKLTNQAMSNEFSRLLFFSPHFFWDSLLVDFQNIIDQTKTNLMIQELDMTLKEVDNCKLK